MCFPKLALITNSDGTPSGRGFVDQDQLERDVMTTYIYVLSLQKVEAPKDASKDRTVFAEAVSLMFRTFSLP
jgi:hypothetical protein